MLGAKSFLEHHTLAKQIGLVMNFEARGTSGPAVMFETSERNGRIVREFAAVAPHPVTSSLSYEAYKLLPNDTDLTFFKLGGLAGLGFAYVDDVAYYHTQYDDLAHLDPRSLQQQGDYALALARHFGGIDLRALDGPDATYFVLPWLGCVVYPVSWSVPLGVAAALLFVVVMALGVRKGRVSAGGTAAGLAAFLVTIAVACVAVNAMWSLAKGHVVAAWQGFAGDPYHPGVYRLAIAAVAVASGGALVALWRPRTRRLNLWAGVLTCWLLLALATSIYMPGASYLFLWPVVWSTIALGIAAMGRGGVMLAWASTIAGVILMAPTIALLAMALTMRMAVVSAASAVLLAGLLIPCLDLIAGAGRWWLPGAAVVAAAGCLVAGASISGIGRDNPITNSMYYGLDSDTGQAMWFSLDPQVDQWTAHYLGASPQRANLLPFVPFRQWPYLTHDAPAAPLPAPLVERLEGGTNELNLHVTSPRQAPRMYLYADEGNPVEEASVDGVRIEAEKAHAGLKPGQKAYAYRMRRFGLCHFNVPKQGIELRMRLRGPAKGYRLEVVDQSYGIDGLPGVTPRPEGMIPFPLMMDSVWVRKAYTF